MEKDFTLLIIISTITILLVLLMMVLIYVGFLKKKSKLILSQREQQMLFEQELAMSQVEIKEQTLSYVGQELHDDIGQKLSVARLMNNQLISNADENYKSNLKEINHLLGESIQDLRNLSKTFIGDQIEHFGLIDSIEFEVKRLRKTKFIEPSFTFNNQDIDINSKHALILFRIVQESINNALKHSKSRSLDIGITDGNKELQIMIKDNGIGFQNANKKGGSGLRNMKNRAKLIGADFHIHSTKGEGTTIQLKYHKN